MDLHVRIKNSFHDQYNWLKCANLYQEGCPGGLVRRHPRGLEVDQLTCSQMCTLPSLYLSLHSKLAVECSLFPKLPDPSFLEEELICRTNFLLTVFS